MLTSFNGHTIAYDGIGNPTTYYNGSAYTFTWTGRQLTGAVRGSKAMSFTYDDNGIRTSKTVDGVTHTYQLNGSQIVSEQWGDKLLVYLYDASGAPIGMMYRTTSYDINSFDVFWFEKNLQGDIVAVYNSAGTKVAYYTYTDAWGNHSVGYINLSTNEGVQYNPFRYRGYYYDTDLGMYYLQSRYYDPNTCRFINADGYVSTGQGLIGNNMFAYCCNNTVMLIDTYGDAAFPYYLLHWRGDIHKEIQDRLEKSGYLIEVPVFGGRIDLVIDGYAYELKPETCPKKRAIKQLERYIKASGNQFVVGMDRPELNGCFDSKYGVSVYYYAGDGIIYYGFYEKGDPLEQIITVPKQEKNHSSVGNAIIAGVAVAGVTAAVYFAGCGGRISPCREMRSPLLFGGY